MEISKERIENLFKTTYLAKNSYLESKREFGRYSDITSNDYSLFCGNYEAIEVLGLENEYQEWRAKNYPEET